MAAICPVCNKKIGWSDEYFYIDDGGIECHAYCMDEFNLNPEKYGEKEVAEQRNQRRKEQQQKIEDQSVHVKSFDMPFEEMVAFIFKWTMASIPTAIFLAILFLIFTAIFA